MEELKDIIINIRKWENGDPNIEDFYIAEDLTRNTISINPELYEKLEDVRYKGKDIYVLKDPSEESLD